MLHLDNGKWNMAFIRQLFDDDDANDILSLPVGFFDHVDVLM